MGTVVTVGVSPAVAHWLRFPALRPGEVNRSADTGYYAAGKAINAARAAKTASADVTCLAPVGGETGQLFRRLLTADGLRLEPVPANSPTRICTTLLAPGQTTELVEEPGPLSAGEVTLLIAAFAAAARNAHAVVAAGTLAAGVPADFYARIIRALPDAPCPVVLDAKGPALLAAVTAADQRQVRLIAKPNLAELFETFPDCRRAPQAALTRLIDAGAWAAVVTDGPGRVLLACGEHVWTIHPPPVEVVSPIGAGDTLAGVLACGLMAKLPVEQAVARSAAAASASCLTVGPAAFDPVVAADLFRQVRVDAPRLLWQASDL